jgi:hypothetical protein
VMTVSNITCTSYGYDGWLRSEICTKVEVIQSKQTLPKIKHDKWLVPVVWYQHFTNLELGLTLL